MTNKEASEIIQKHKDMINNTFPNSLMAINNTEALVIAIKVLEQQDKERWIPVSERFPERDVNSFGDTLSHSKEVLVIIKYDNSRDDGEQYMAWFDNDKYDMYVEALKTGECDGSVVPEKEAWNVYKKGTTGVYEDLYIKSVIAWQPLPETYREPDSFNKVKEELSNWTQ
ncbi:hypothetical protein FYJ38_00540 [Clostridium sp. WB02_MRS01]|uniref:hypothetical protein n=1 Tax=Clostridium sp. WB02_MRS01 TaxID=2605777 RepID=UPI0012B1A8F1|nr:hypothetical protein [Clostridium sp. WB02_MRS01]MSS07127.1 hypothetical protein [Clostridium sp. WB02_MRS01]